MLGDAARLDRDGIEAGFGVRCTLGVAIPLLLALGAGAPLAGVSAAIGAMSAGFASRQGVYRTRAAAMLLTSAAMAASAYVGALAGGRPILDVLLLAAWGLGLGLLGALGASATTVGLNAVIALVIFGNPPYGPPEALPQALLVFAGGGLQTLLLVLVWPLQRFRAERSALASAYRALAAYAGSLPRGELGSPAAQAFASAGTILADPQPFGRRSELAAFEALRDQAERLRASLAAFATGRHALQAGGGGAAAALVGELAAGAQPILEELAAALDQGRAPAELGAQWHALDLRGAALEARAAHEPLGAAAIEDARSFLAQLRTAWRAAGVPAERSAASPLTPRAAQPFALSAVGDALATLRANCSPRSVYARHALRLAALLALAGLLAHVLPLQRAYWIALTAVIVLRPDFSTTYKLGVQRVAGTLIGAVVASLVTVLLRPGHDLYLALAIAFAGIGYTLFAVNYAIFSITVTAFVVFLLAFAGAPEQAAAADRVSATLLGGALAMAAFGIWPSWSRERVPDDVAELVEAERRYGALVLSAYAHPQGYDARAVRDAQLATRRARSAAEASVEQMLAEPVRPHALGVRAVLRLLAATRRFGVAALTLQARLPRSEPLAAAALPALAAGLDETLARVRDALRAGEPMSRTPALRDTQIALKIALDAAPEPNLAAVVSETDLMVESAQAMIDALRRNAARDSAR